MTREEMRDFVIDCCGDGCIYSQEIDITFPNGKPGKDTEYICWLPIPGESWNGNGVLYVYGNEIGIVEVEEKSYDQLYPRAEVKRGRLPKDQFIDRDGVRRYRSVYFDR